MNKVYAINLKLPFKAFHILATTKSAEKKHFNANESITKNSKSYFK